jgi:hypothetical protein
MTALLAGAMTFASFVTLQAPAGASAPVRSSGTVHLVLHSAHSFTPRPPAGAHDLYHCSVVNPNFKQDMMVTSSNFRPGTKEVHHAILYRVPAEYAAQAWAQNNHGKGWTCFSEPTVSGAAAITEFSGMPWLCGWAPGHGASILPAGTAVPMQAGSVLIMQIHYNTLIGHKPDSSSISLTAVPTSKSDLKTVTIQQLPAPPEIPCPAGITGPLCDRAASIAYTAKRFGPNAATTVYGLEAICGRNPMNPPVGNSTSCTWPVATDEVIRQITPHMHLLGQSMTVTLDPGTPQARVLMNDPHYNFDAQVADSLSPAVVVPAGSTIQVSCTYNPKLRQFNPQTKNLAPQFITWGDGSADEMCLAILATTAN